MNTMVYPFRIGATECTIVSDGNFVYPQPGQLLFDEVPVQQLNAALTAHSIDPATWDGYLSPYPSLLIKSGGRVILVDTGAGAFAPTTGQLLPNLRAIGVMPEQIDTVVLTHGHADHIGGNVDSTGQLVFPHARWIMSRAEWDYWAADPDLAEFKLPMFIDLLRSVARTQLSPIQKRLTLVDDGAEIAPGVQVVAAYGHTPGHIALRITSAGEQLLWAVDTCLHPIHVEQPDWVSKVDHLPQAIVTTRRKLLGQAAVDGALVHFYHFPFPGLGRVVQHNGSWRWQPIVTTTA